MRHALIEAAPFLAFAGFIIFCAVALLYEVNRQKRLQRRESDAMRRHLRGVDDK